MKRRKLLSYLGMGAIASAAAHGCSRKKPPAFSRPREGEDPFPSFPGERLNVLMIMCDDMNRRLSCYGDAIAVTPNIDRLAKTGVVFLNAHCQYPLCNPSRTSMLSGLYPMTTQVWDNTTHLKTTFPDLSFLPHHFRRHGYWTARVGKIFHDHLDDPDSWDFAYPVFRLRLSKQRVPRTTIASPYKGAVGFLQWEAVDVSDWQLSDGRLVRMAGDLIKTHLEQRPEQPFFIAVGIIRPHLPWIVPRKYFDLYDPSLIPLPPTLRLVPTGPLLSVLHYDPQLTNLPDEVVRIATRAYYACLSYADFLVGFLLDTLEEHRIRERTIILLTSDHGHHLGEHGGCWEKRTLFEESTGVPLIISAPHTAAVGAQCPRTVELVDLYPTLCQLCALPAPSHRLQGKSVVALLMDPLRTWSKPAVSMFYWPPYTGYTLRTEDWRLTQWKNGTELLELYDHNADGAEMKNLAGDSRYSGVVAGLSDLLRRRIWAGSVL